MSLLRRLAAGFRSFMQGDTGFATPDITRAQQLAIGQAIIAVLVVFGFDVDEDTRQLILALAATLAAALPISDAVVRQGRAKHVSEIREAQEESAGGPAPLTGQERLWITELRDRLKPPG